MDTIVLYSKGRAYAVGTDLELARLRSLGMLPPDCHEIRRAALVEPYRLPLRWGFRVLRRLFGEHGPEAEFTRRWRCRWRVDARLLGGPVEGPFQDREGALAAERAWVLEWLKLRVAEDRLRVGFDSRPR